MKEEKREDERERRWEVRGNRWMNEGEGLGKFDDWEMRDDGIYRERGRGEMRGWLFGFLVSEPSFWGDVRLEQSYK